jgi:hypothetical protein
VWRKKTNNMLLLMLDPQFKSFHLVSSFVDHEQGISITENYDKKLYILCFWNVVIIYILCQIAKLNLQTKKLMKIATWIFFKWLLAQVNKSKNKLIKSCWVFGDFKHMLKKLNIFSNGGKNMNLFSLLLVFFLANTKNY